MPICQMASSFLISRANQLIYTPDQWGFVYFFMRFLFTFTGDLRLGRNTQLLRWGMSEPLNPGKDLSLG